ncbi:hypothetical protein Hanom_Chr05g00418461 [Helianthus anomalus]
MEHHDKSYVPYASCDPWDSCSCFCFCSCYGSCCLSSFSNPNQPPTSTTAASTTLPIATTPSIRQNPITLHPNRTHILFIQQARKPPPTKTLLTYIPNPSRTTLLIFYLKKF